MRAQLLVIDGTTHAPTLIRMLERDGYGCHQARGPMRVRTLLDEEPVDLIVWREEPGNPELTRDLLRECSDHPEIPIIHLFEHAIPHPAVAGHPQIRESLPAGAAATRILTLLNRIFDRPAEQQASQPQPKTELAFRHLVANLWQNREYESAHETNAANRIQAPVTSINLAERESLAAIVGMPRPQSLLRRMTRWLTRWI
jgi:DNA-binding NtrC family response regulator